MKAAQLSAAYAPRLTALAAQLGRKRIVRRMPLPPDIELHSWEWALLRGQWRRFYGEMK